MIKYVGFDKDGTLLDSQEAITRAYGKIIYNDFGIDAASAENIFGKVALGKPILIQLALTLDYGHVRLSSEELAQKANDILVRLGRAVKASPYPETIETLTKLKTIGYRLFVSSNHQEDVVKDDLKRTGILQYLDFYAGIRLDEPDYKKGLAHFQAAANHYKVNFADFIKQTVFVGDTPEDIKVCQNINVISIGRIGLLSQEKLLEAGARFIIPDLSVLPGLLESL